jgi:hypothetical protein
LDLLWSFDARNVHEDFKDLVENGETALKIWWKTAEWSKKDLVGNG